LVLGVRTVFANLIWMILLVTAVVGLFVPGFMNYDNVQTILWSSVSMAFMVVGMFFVMLTGNLDLSLESSYGCAPVIGVIAISDLNNVMHVPPELSVLFCLLTGAFIGLVNGGVSVWLKVNPFLVTLAALLLWRGVVIALIPEGLYDLPKGLTFLGGEKLGGSFPLAILVGAALFLVTYFVVNRTVFGRAIYAIGSNRQAAYVSGINVARVQVAVFVIAGFLSGIGGMIEVGRIGAVVDDLGQGEIMMVFAAAILGGTALAGGSGKISGVLAAVLEIGVINDLLNLMGVSPSMTQIVFALVLFAAIILASFQERLLGSLRT
jgi:ribose/xylose/arabinose/galactoside ABC-type transport system permease subunit